MNLRQLAARLAKRAWHCVNAPIEEHVAQPVNAETLSAAARQPSEHILRSLQDLRHTPSALNPRLIFDVGMHVGQDTDFYLKKGFSVVAVEANPILAAQAEKRFETALRDGRLTILNIGIGEERSQAEFHVNLELSEWSSFKPATASRGMPTAPVTVEMNTIADLVHAFGTPYYLKIDIEGLDGAAVKGLCECPVKPRFVSFENGDLHLFDALVGFGYTRFKFINQADVPGFACPTPAREGGTIEYSFPYGASGPFGDDTPGAWLDADAMRPILQQHAAERASGTYDAVKSGWFDLHARID